MNYPLAEPFHWLYLKADYTNFIQIKNPQNMAWPNAVALSKDFMKTTAYNPSLSALSIESVCQKDNQNVIRQLSHEA